MWWEVAVCAVTVFLEDIIVPSKPTPKRLSEINGILRMDKHEIFLMGGIFLQFFKIKFVSPKWIQIII